MKKIVQKVFSLILLLTAFSAHSQDISGIWRGYFITDGGEQYKYEVQLDHTKKNTLTGVTYSYLDTRFYGKATFTGNYTRKVSAALVQEIRTVEVRMAGGSVACIMKCRLVYSRSGREEFLEGIYTSTYEKDDPYFGSKRGGDCGGGKVFLRKVSTSDFYVEPFLRAKKGEPKKDTATTLMAKKPPAKTPATTPARTKPAPQAETTVSKPVEKAVITTPEAKKPEDVVASTKPAAPKTTPIPITVRDRRNELIKVITLNNSEVEVSLYDNGEIDDDTISIYQNGVLLLGNKRLSNKPITFTIKLDENSPEQTLVMVAENLGRIPPNTSLMIIQDGDKRHQVSITSTEQKNAMIRFRYKKDDTP